MKRVLFAATALMLVLGWFVWAQEKPAGGEGKGPAAAANAWESVASTAGVDVRTVVFDSNGWLYMSVTGGDVRRSRDKGQTWEALPGTGADETSKIALCLNAAGEVVALVGDRARVFRLVKNGAIWKQAQFQDAGGKNVTPGPVWGGVTAAPDLASGNLVVANGVRLYISRDGIGDTLREVPAPTEPHPWTGWLTLRLNPKTHDLIMGSEVVSSGMWRSSDGGYKWTWIGLGAEKGNSNPCFNSDGEVFDISTSNQYALPVRWTEGTTWIKSCDGLKPGGYRCSAIGPYVDGKDHSPRAMFLAQRTAANNTNNFVSLDQGRSWKPAGHPNTIPPMTRTFAVGDDGYLYAATSKDGIWRLKANDLSLDTISLPAGRQDGAYSVETAARGGNAPYGWAAAGLPPGLTIDATSGAISGVPRTAGKFAVVVSVSDSSYVSTKCSRTYSLEIAPKQ